MEALHCLTFVFGGGEERRAGGGCVLHGRKNVHVSKSKSTLAGRLFASACFNLQS